MNITKPQFIRILRGLAYQAEMSEMWYELTLVNSISDGDLNDACKIVAVSMFVHNQHDNWLATYLKLCNKHGPHNVVFLPE